MLQPIREGQMIQAWRREGKREQMESPDVGSRGHVLGTRWGTAWNKAAKGIRAIHVEEAWNARMRESDLVFPEAPRGHARLLSRKGPWCHSGSAREQVVVGSRKTRRPGSWLLRTVPEKDSKV